MRRCVTLALTSDTISLRQLSDLADTLLAQRLAELTGVGHVTVQGGIRPAVRIQADLSRLATYGIGLEDLRNVIVAANVAGAKGALDGAHQSYTIAANDQITVAEAYRTIVIAYRNGAPVLLRDVADVVDGLENDQGRRLVSGHAGRRGRHPAPARRQRDRDGPAHQDRAAATAALDAHRRHAHRGARCAPTRIRASVHDVQFTLILSVALVVTGRAHLPAHRPRHHHRRRRAAAVADRDLRRHVVLRLLARQSVADGADDRHRLRRRRRHRHDREHRPPHRGRARTRSRPRCAARARSASP